MVVSIQQRKTKEGTPYVTATVRVSPYPPVSRTFPTKKEAKEWGREHETGLKKQGLRALAGPCVSTHLGACSLHRARTAKS